MAKHERRRRRAPREVAYTVWHTGEVRTASAEEILRAIQRSSRASGELRSMSVRRYAKALVEDGPYFLPKRLLDYFERRDYSTQFDRALEYLAAMPTSGVRILARKTNSSIRSVPPMPVRKHGRDARATRDEQ